MSSKSHVCLAMRARRGASDRSARPRCCVYHGKQWIVATSGQPERGEENLPGLVGSSKSQFAQYRNRKSEQNEAALRPPPMMQCGNSLLESGCCSRGSMVICPSGTTQRALVHLPVSALYTQQRGRALRSDAPLRARIARQTWLLELIRQACHPCLASSSTPASLLFPPPPSP